MFQFKNETQAAFARRSLESLLGDLHTLADCVKDALEGKPESQWKKQLTDFLDNDGLHFTIGGLDALSCPGCGEMIWSLEFDEGLDLCPKCLKEHQEGFQEDEEAQ
ncbi:hypothetical protein [Armatimonas sp.]|uniref:hypothetical protein n=1 Tax=Armatimonas sp. TaxID=1872638 RepID=UPI003751D79E